MSLYDMNRQLMASKPTLSEEQVLKTQPSFVNWALAHPGKYYLLLNNELHYYTFFALDEMLSTKNVYKLMKEFYDTLPYIGDVKDLAEEDNGSGVYALWSTFKNDPSYGTEQPAAFVFYLFPYDGGVVEV